MLDALCTCQTSHPVHGHVYVVGRVARNTPMMCALFMTLADMIIYSQLMLIRLKAYGRLRSGTPARTPAHTPCRVCVCVRVITFSSAATDATRPMDIDIARAT